MDRGGDGSRLLGGVSEGELDSAFDRALTPPRGSAVAMAVKRLPELLKPVAPRSRQELLPDIPAPPPEVAVDPARLLPPVPAWGAPGLVPAPTQAHPAPASTTHHLWPWVLSAGVTAVGLLAFVAIQGPT